MLHLLVSIMCLIIVVVMFIHIIKSWNSENKKTYKKINEIVYTLAILAFAIYYPFLIFQLGGNIKGVLFPTAVEEFTLLGNVLIVGGMLGLCAWGISAKIRTIRNPELLKEQNNYEYFCNKFLEEYPDRGKMRRRITHILPGAVVILCIVIFYFLQGMLGNAWSNYALFFIIIIGVDFALAFILEGLIRSFDFAYCPNTVSRMLNAGLTSDELDTFASTAIMVFSFGPFLFFNFPIFFIVLLITSVSDAMAAIVGTLFSNKKHNFPKSTDKTIEGYIGGFVSTFLCTLFGVVFSNFFGLSDASIWSIELALYLAIFLSIVFVLIDIITSKIKLSDNYLNPFISGIAMILFLMFLNISIF